ncbi:MAG: hypothetical protein JXB88_07755 [Spirochaetales bacterium]|nr:hypothetical protein [Spirochaetales bacterium]
MNNYTKLRSIECGINKELTYLDISFDPKWEYIPLAKSFIEDFLTINMVNNEEIHKVGTAASELLENAVRYNHQNGIRMSVQNEVDESMVYLIIINYSDEMHAKRLLKRIKEMNKNDSLEYYLFRMRESIRNKGDSPGLGLARVFHESKAKITAEYNKEQKIVEVRASIPL